MFTSFTFLAFINFSKAIAPALETSEMIWKGQYETGILCLTNLNHREI